MTNDLILKSASLTCNILAFYVNDTTSTYCLDYFEKGEHTISKWVSYGDPNIDGASDFGTIPPDCIKPDALETVFGFIGKILGQGFYQIEEDAPMLHYKHN